MTEARRRTSPLCRGLMAAAKARVARVSFVLGEGVSFLSSVMIVDDVDDDDVVCLLPFSRPINLPPERTEGTKDRESRA